LILDESGWLKLADFGLPMISNEFTTKERASETGTPGLSYRSPQLLDGNVPTALDDIYSIGASLYELLTGIPPFTLGDIPHQIRNVQPKPLGERLAESGMDVQIPEGIAALVLSCLEKSPARRPQSAPAMTEMINRLAAIRGVPPTPAVPAPIHGKAVEESEAFERQLPLAAAEDQARTDSLDMGRPATMPWLKILAGVCALAIIPIAMALRNKNGKSTVALTPAEKPSLIEPGHPDANTAPAQPAVLKAREQRGTYVGEGPAFSYTYRPQQARALDTNAVNVGVRFIREEPKPNCSFIIVDSTNSNAFGTITYQFRAAPGYVIEDMRISQSASFYTSGRVRGAYSIDGGNTFTDFFLTPPYAGKSFGFGRAPTLSSLNSPIVIIRYLLLCYSGKPYDAQFLRDCDDSYAPLEFNGSVKPESSPNPSNEFFATPNKTMGLKALKVEDGSFAVAQFGGADVWKVPKLKSPHYIYFDIQDDFLPKEGTPLTFELEYYDSGFGNIILQYDSTDTAQPDNGAFKPHDTVPRRNTRRWHKTSWLVTDGRFAGSKNKHADFRIYVSGDDLMIRSIRLTRLGL
jgi:hypothetical protein